MSPSASSRAQTMSAALNHNISVEGQTIVVEPWLAPLGEIRLDPNNPRISHAVSQHPKKGSLSQEDLCKLILDEQPGMSDVFRAIRDNGGLMDPILVRPDGRVIEGNCRVATFMRLNSAAKGKDSRWTHIPTFVIPKITERQVAVLQGQYHVMGKNKWRAYEQAGHVYNLHKRHGMDPKAIAKALGTQERVVTRQLEAYETMTKKVLPRGGGLNKWSHVEELYKNKDLKDFRSKARNIDKFVDLVIKKRINKGAEVRKLPNILKSTHATKALETKGTYEAISIVGRQDPTVDSVVFKRMKEMTGLLRGMQAGKDIQRLKDEQKARQLLKELYMAVNTVAKTAGLKL